MKKTLFDYDFRFAGLKDVGRTRTSNQDEVILCPERGFFAVSDGMGGLKDGGKTSAMIRDVFPDLFEHVAEETGTDASLESAAELLKNSVAVLSDSIYESGNEGHTIEFGATFCGVWLLQKCALFVNLGDSRGYILRASDGVLTQVTRDHNLAALLVESGDLSKEEAKHHHASSRITRFMGMPSPATPETFLETVAPGDTLLFCSDGLHGMLEDEQIRDVLLKGMPPEPTCRQLIDAANEAGGRDNISAVCVRIRKRGLFG
ncbi:MAG TPA: protein phosphatase 2C domain-containing protein [Eubacteriales bacterium]|nr:protein phosphatase 2C domain-containing protein [Eubacteriales bacterium]